MLLGLLSHHDIIAQKVDNLQQSKCKQCMCQLCRVAELHQVHLGFLGPILVGAFLYKKVMDS